MRKKICVPCCLSEVLLHVAVSVQNCWFGIMPVESLSSQAYFVIRQPLPFTLKTGQLHRIGGVCYRDS